MSAVSAAAGRGPRGPCVHDCAGAGAARGLVLPGEGEPGGLSACGGLLGGREQT